MQELDAFEIAAPKLEVFMGIRYDVTQTIGAHHRMRALLGAMQVELFLQKRIYGAIQSKRKPWRPSNTKFRIETVAKRTIQEQIDLRSACLEWFVALGIEDIACPSRIVIV